MLHPSPVSAAYVRDVRSLLHATRDLGDAGTALQVPRCLPWRLQTTWGSRKQGVKTCLFRFCILDELKSGLLFLTQWHWRKEFTARL